LKHGTYPVFPHMIYHVWSSIVHLSFSDSDAACPT